MTITANPVYLPPTEFSHPALGPWSVAGMEGLLLGLVLWRWTRGGGFAVLVGFLINALTLGLFWMALRREDHLWDYDFRVVCIGEIFVVVAEAGAVAWYVSHVLGCRPSAVWMRAFVLSVVLNALSFFAGARLVQSPIPDEQSGAWLINPGCFDSSRSCLSSR